MISFHLEAADLENIRFAYSPLLEAVTSYRTLYLSKYAPNLQWAEDARRSLEGVNLPYLDDLGLISHWIPDFMTPTPARVERSFEDELARMRGVSDAVLRHHIQMVIEAFGETEIRRQFLAYPHESLECLIEDLRVYWQHALARHWPRIVSVLESDMLYHARLLALKGVDEMMNELHPKLRYQPGVMLIDKEPCIYDGNDFHLNGSGIQLIPAVFSTQALSWQIAPEWQPMLIYGARGAGLWYEPCLPDPEQALITTLGEGKARLLMALKSPAHTTDLARQLDVTAGAVSQQLSKLSQAGLVESNRSSNHVYYHLTSRGEKLLLLFGG